MSGFLVESLWYNDYIMAVLYQKYRPRTFAEVVGQGSITRTLLNASKNGELAHAYLFTGSRGVGKTTIARVLAKAVNCQNLNNGDPCGKCEVCTAIANGSSLDIIEIDAASHTGVDNVRELIEHAQFRPTVMKTKVFIIDEIHMLSKAAFNALLKTLEEPPEHVMFILATTDIDKVPETIISRTQRYDFKRINSVDMTKALELIAKDQKLKLSDGVIEAVIAQSDGSMRDALSRLNMVISLGEKITLEDAQQLLGVAPVEIVQTLITKITTNEATGLPDFFESILASGVDVTVLNRSILEYLREILNAKLTGQMNSHKDDAVFNTHVQSLSVQKLLFVVRLFLRSYKELSEAPSPDLPLLLASVEAALHGVESKTTHHQQSQHIQPLSAEPLSAEPLSAESDLGHTTSSDATEDSDATKDSDTVMASSAVVGKQTNNGNIDVTIEEIKLWWPDVINRIRAKNSPIATLLKNSPVTEVLNGRITVAVKYLFHKEHLDNKKHNALITETISAVSGKNLVLRSVIRTDIKVSSIAQTVDSINDALKVFGGELVE